MLGSLVGERAGRRLDLLAEPTRDSLQALGLLDEIGVVEIDPSLSDTEASRVAFALKAETLANCVIVAGRRAGEERFAACVVGSDRRADVNGRVRRHLDVRKASFLASVRAVELTGMEHGGITPFGLPQGWPVLIEARLTDASMLVLGSGIRPSKLLVPGHLLSRLPDAVVLDDLAIRPAGAATREG